LAFAATQTPFYNAETAFTVGATTPAETAAGVAQFEASLSTLARRHLYKQSLTDISLLPAFHGPRCVHVYDLLLADQRRILSHIPVP
jgi:hypothetical protein